MRVHNGMKWGSYPHSLVSDTENSFCVCTDDQVEFASFGLLQESLFHLGLSLKGQVHALGLAKEMGIGLDNIALTQIV
jgi:hypothetical protein